jgi:hypothetical protein
MMQQSSKVPAECTMLHARNILVYPYLNWASKLRVDDAHLVAAEMTCKQRV